MLVYFIFAILGIFLFRGVVDGEIVSEEYNFTNFHMAMIMLFTLSTGEEWPTILHDVEKTEPDCIEGKNCGSNLSPLYFIVFVMLCTFIMLNLFVLIILQQFDLYYFADDNILE